MTMNAVVQESFGGPEVLRLAELDTPRPLGNEVLVQVRVAGVNPVDWKTRAGGGVLDRFPIILGWDLSGLVVETGGGVTRFEPGDEVFGMPLFPRQAGAYAEFVAAPSRQLALKPAGLSHLEAGGLSLAGLTAWQIIDEVANVQAEQRVLVNAACGGVGHLAVQIAKARGAFVIGTARESGHPLLRELGCDEVLDYRVPEILEAVRDLDLVLDPVGGEDCRRWLDHLRRGGLLVAFNGGVTPGLHAAARERGLRASALLVEPDRVGLEALAALLEAGQLRVVVDRTFRLTEAAEAHRIGETGRTRGKIVLIPD